MVGEHPEPARSVRFDVFGYVVEVTREADGWIARYLGGGVRRAAEDLPIPPDLAEADLARHLADLCHERARPGLTVRRLDRPRDTRSALRSDE